MDEAELKESPAAPPAAQPAVREKGLFGGTGLTVVLCLLVCAGLFLMRWAENKSYSWHHGSYHEKALEESLLVQSVYENEPRGVRWLSGYLTVGSFYREQTAGALAAERDGYLTPAARQIMAMAANRMGDGAKAAYWREGPPPQLPGTALEEANRDVLRQWPPGQSPSLETILQSLENPVPFKEASPLYWRTVWNFSILIVLGILLLPLGAQTIHLLQGRQGTRAGCAAAPAWQPGRMFGSWLRAEWCFAFGGLVFTTLYYAASFFVYGNPDGSGSGAHPVLTAWVKFHESVFTGWAGPLVSLALTAGPVWLLARKYCGGLRGMVRLFRLGWTGQDWPRILGNAAGGAWIAFMVLSILAPVMLRLGWFDDRDGWRFAGEATWEALFYSCLMAPVVEELSFRGFLFTAFANRWSALKAALLSSFVFAAMHGYSWTGFIIVMGYGMLFCGLYRRTGSLWPSMLAHALINFLIFAPSIAT